MKKIKKSPVLKKKKVAKTAAARVLSVLRGLVAELLKLQNLHEAAPEGLLQAVLAVGAGDLSVGLPAPCFLRLSEAETPKEEQKAADASPKGARTLTPERKP